MNKKIIFAVIIVIALIGAIAAGVMVTKTILSKEETILLDFDTARARGHVEQLIKNGPRMSGSDAEKKGAEYIVSQYEAAGLQNCHIETYSVNMFEINKAEVSLVEYGPMMNIPRPLGTTITYEHITDYVLQGYSGSLQWSNFLDDMEMVVIGNGTDPDQYNAASGKAAIIETSDETPGNPTMYEYAYNAGAKAIILHNLVRGEQIGYPPMFKSNQAIEDWSGSFPEIPFFMVSKEAGVEMKQHIGNMKLRLDFDVFKGKKDICVTVGEIPGTSGSDDLYVLGGHHDTCYNTLGVVDNTVGPAICIEMAQQMAKYKPKHTIRFCTWGGEEEGLYGSLEYFEAHKAELEANVKWYSNFDMSHTNLKRTNGATLTTSKNSTIPIMEDYRDRMIDDSPELSKYNVAIRYDDGKWAGSDQYPFARSDIDVTNAWGGGSYEYHTHLDNMDQLNEESLQISGRIIGSFILNEAMG